VRLEGIYVNKNPLTLAGIEPATFRFAAQHNTAIALFKHVNMVVKTSLPNDELRGEGK